MQTLQSSDATTGLGRALTRIDRRATGATVLVSIKGAVSFGADLARIPLETGIAVCGSRSHRPRQRPPVPAPAADWRRSQQPVRTLLNARCSKNIQRSGGRGASTARTVDWDRLPVTKH
ncbi:hypothetical protein ACX80D_12115 [Arthrobacter sp. Sr24]